MAPKPDRRRRRSLVAAILIVAISALYVVAAWNSAFDRESGGNPAAEQLVAGPFRAKADAARSYTLLRAEENEKAAAAAARAISSDPIDRNPTALLGAALLASGNATGADAAFRVAAQFGWRQSLTQLYWLQVGLATSDWDTAALRMDALLRSDPEMPNADMLLSRFEADAAGRAALSRRLAENPPWTQQYLLPGERFSPKQLALRGETLTALAETGGALGCEPVKAFTEQLVLRGQYDRAESVWDAHCPQAVATGALRDPRFARLELSARPDPLGWRAQSDADLVIRPRDEGGVELENTGIGAMVALSQPVLWNGSRTFAWGADRGERIALTVDCGQPARPDFSQDGRVTLSAPQCPTRHLRVWIAPGSGPVMLPEISS